MGCPLFCDELVFQFNKNKYYNKIDNNKNNNNE